jgi:prepilin-type N-terminal cleavage/methylation domain-containing protein
MSARVKESGFTLIELLMVSFLLSILGVSVLQVVTQIQSAAQTAEEKRSVLEQNFRAFTNIRSRVMALGTSPLPPLQNSGTGAPQAFAGRAFGMNRSFEVIENPQSGSMIRFMTKSSGLASPMNRFMYGEIEVRLFVDVQHTERPLVMEYWNPSPVPLPEPLARVTLLRNVTAISVRNFVFNGWQSNWDNPYAPKPSLLELTIMRTVEGNQNDFFRAAIPLYQTS